MKKIKLLSSISLAMIIFTVPAVKADEQSVLISKKPYINIKRTETKKEEGFTFRKTKWGMSQQQVHETEGKQPVLQEADKIIYQDKLLNLGTKVIYYFEKGKLFKGTYFFDGTFTNQVEYIVNYKKLKHALKDKYGSPSSDNNAELDEMDDFSYDHMGELVSRGVHDLETKWETPSTNITLLLSGKDLMSKVRLELYYNSRNLKYLEDERKDFDNFKF